MPDKEVAQSRDSTRILVREGTFNDSAEVCLALQSCGRCFDAVAPRMEGRWTYKGQGQGTYIQVEEVQYVGAGNGNLVKKVHRTTQPRAECIIGWVCCALFLISAAVSWFFLNKSHAADSTECALGQVVDRQTDWDKLYTAEQRQYCCERYGRACKVQDTEEAVEAVDTEDGFDCTVGASNWIKSWSFEKMDWCCKQQQVGCRKFHCSGVEHTWEANKREWCCNNFQKGCQHTPPLHCQAVCVLQGEKSTCFERMQWAMSHIFLGKENSCNLAYSHVQVECDTCRACSIQDAGCPVLGPSPVFDCSVSLKEFARAWSETKKKWCCRKYGKGCEGSSPPAVDPGDGKTWAHQKVQGGMTWVAKKVP